MGEPCPKKKTGNFCVDLPKLKTSKAPSGRTVPTDNIPIVFKNLVLSIILSLKFETLSKNADFSTSLFLKFLVLVY
jgi:hypothetical protein